MLYDQELNICIKAALSAGGIQLKYKNRIHKIKKKQDSSPVSEVDKKCEIAIREIIFKHFPHDGFLGEETGEEKGTSGRKWIVDPLDGTRPYLRGIPTHSALIALEENGDIVCGCMHLPALKETYWAKKGGGAFLNNSKIHVSKTKNLSLAIGSVFGFIENQHKSSGKALISLMKKLDYVYGFMDAYSYGCIACGKLDVCINLLDMPWDCAAAACIIKEAGGKFSDLKGNFSIYNKSTVVTNGILHNQVLNYFQ
jgi:histidinol phosphatase-like enzyme (inositol monophosphatase family)